MRPRVCPRDGAEGEDDREGDADEARDDAGRRIVAREDPSNPGGGKISSGADDEPRRDVVEEAREPGESRERRTRERGAREECPGRTAARGARGKEWRWTAGKGAWSKVLRFSSKNICV